MIHTTIIYIIHESNIKVYW